ncbi:MAG: hypothetical protein M3362_00270 [Acidobacteriota bacterium]|nr:hypothetical protein [Acidobacteriota bacterium]
MNEEFIDPEYSTEETETFGSGNEQQNNTSNASESETTQKTGRTAQDRIRQLVEENRRLKAQVQPADKPSLAGDKVLNAKVDILYKAPEHLKSKADEIASYAAQYGVPTEDAIALFDAKGKVSQADVEAAQVAQTEAAQSRTGGTANPQTRSETQDVSKMSKDELTAKLNQALQSGERI